MAPKKKPAMSGRLSLCARTLHQLGNVPVADMMDVNNYPNLSRFSRATLFRHAKNLLDEDMYDLRHQNKGRPCLTTKQGLRDKRQTNALSETSRSFSAIDLQKSCGMSSRVSAVTFRRALNSLGYNCSNTRRQGMLLKKNVKARRTWCGKAIRHNLLSHNIFRAGLSMYVDGLEFEYKSNPYEHAKCLKKEWRTIREGLHFSCTARGNKKGKNYVKFMVGMAYNRGVVMHVPLHQKMSGGYYSQLVETEISPLLDGMNGCSCKILQDGCPCQNSRKAFRMMQQKNTSVCDTS